MNPITAKLCLFAPFAALLVASATLSQDEAPPPKVLTNTKVTENVFILEGDAGNAGLCYGPDGALLVDAQFADSAKSIQTAIDGLRKIPVTPRIVINTHHHPDHTGGNSLFGKTAVVIAHENVRRRMLDAKPPAPPAWALPTVTFADSATVHFNGLELRLKHYAGAHTDGDTVVEFAGANVWQLGDLFFNKRFPFIDLRTGGSLAGLERALDSLIPLIAEDARIIPGHGMLATKADLVLFREMLANTRRIVTEAMQNGKTADQIVSDKLLAFYANWSWEFITTERYVAMLVSEIGKEAKAGK